MRPEAIPTAPPRPALSAAARTTAHLRGKLDGMQRDGAADEDVVVLRHDHVVDQRHVHTLQFKTASHTKHAAHQHLMGRDT